MKIIISLHAKQRMLDRNISHEMIYNALLRPDEIGQDKNNEKRFVAKKIYFDSNTRKKHLLLIIYEEVKTAINVITIISTSKIDKYLK